VNESLITDYRNLLFTKQMVAQREMDRVKSNQHTHTKFYGIFVYI